LWKSYLQDIKQVEVKNFINFTYQLDDESCILVIKKAICNDEIRCYMLQLIEWKKWSKVYKHIIIYNKPCREDKTFFINDISKLNKPIYYSLIHEDTEIPEEIIKQSKAFLCRVLGNRRSLVCTSTLKNAEYIAEWLDSISISNKLSQ